MLKFVEQTVTALFAVSIVVCVLAAGSFAVGFGFGLAVTLIRVGFGMGT